MICSVAFIENGSVESLWDKKTKKELQEFCEDEGWVVVSKSKNKWRIPISIHTVNAYTHNTVLDMQEADLKIPKMDE